MSLSSSEAENLAIAMLSVVSARSKCSTKVARSSVSGFKPCDINMALWLLGALFARESTFSDSSNYWLLLDRGGICDILELRLQSNLKILYCGELVGFFHLLTDVTLLLEEAFCFFQNRSQHGPLVILLCTMLLCGSYKYRYEGYFGCNYDILD